MTDDFDNSDASDGGGGGGGALTFEDDGIDIDVAYAYGGNLFISDGVETGAVSSTVLKRKIDDGDDDGDGGEAPKPKKARAKKDPNAPPPKPRKPASEQAKRAKVERIRQSHRRKTEKEATELLDAALDAYGDSTAREAYMEAMQGQKTCMDALRNVRAVTRSTEKVPGDLRKMSSLLKALRAKRTAADVEKTAQLLDSCASTIEQLVGESRQQAANIDTLAKRYGENAARCVAVVARSSSYSAIGGGVGGAGAGAGAGASGGSTAVMVAPSNREAISRALTTAQNASSGGAGTNALMQLSPSEHAVMAMRVGANGTMTITTSTRPASVLKSGVSLPEHLNCSLARDGISMQDRDIGAANRRAMASRRVAAGAEKVNQHTRLTLEHSLGAGAMQALPAIVSAAAIESAQPMRQIERARLTQ